VPSVTRAEMEPGTKLLCMTLALLTRPPMLCPTTTTEDADLCAKR
jgi:hypothetical protein